MKKFFVLTALLLAISFFPKKIYAVEYQAGASARLASNSALILSARQDERVLALTQVFKKYNSPLAPYAFLYVKYADLYNVDWKLLPSISGLESSFGIFLMPESYNAYGWGGGYIYFNSWEDGIKTINKALRENYINRGADDVYKIGPIYAEAKHWSTRVAFFMNEINNEYIKLIAERTPTTL